MRSAVKIAEMLHKVSLLKKKPKKSLWRKLDRLARNMKDLTNTIETINNKGATLKILNQKIDTSTTTGRDESHNAIQGEGVSHDTVYNVIKETAQWI
ncbi:MAG: recombinase family protein [Desulfobacterium sp.]|jgi:DNA invertase Pin-like site-specific DNA recombinase|nr:recombinase family protein [Desulfobacterium sp.]